MCGIHKIIKLFRWCAHDTECVPNRGGERFESWIGRLTAYLSFTHKNIGYYKVFNPRKIGIHKALCAVFRTEVPQNFETGPHFVFWAVEGYKAAADPSGGK